MTSDLTSLSLYSISIYLVNVCNLKSSRHNMRDEHNIYIYTYLPLHTVDLVELELKIRYTRPLIVPIIVPRSHFAEASRTRNDNGFFPFKHRDSWHKRLSYIYNVPYVSIRTRCHFNALSYSRTICITMRHSTETI